MPRYVIENLGTGHVFYRFDNLKTAIEYYHKIPRRVHGTIALSVKHISTKLHKSDFRHASHQRLKIGCWCTNSRRG